MATAPRYPWSGNLQLMATAPRYPWSGNKQLVATAPRYPWSGNLQLVATAPRYPWSGNLQLVATKLPRTLEVYVVVSFYGTSIIDIQLTAHLFAFKGFIFLQVTKLS